MEWIVFLVLVFTIGLMPALGVFALAFGFMVLLFVGVGVLVGLSERAANKGGSSDV